MSTKNFSLYDVALRLHPDDSVAIAKVNLEPGMVLMLDDNHTLTVQQLIPSGHKVALCALSAGKPVRRYGQIIGFATQSIQPGEHIHVHNLGMEEFTREYAFGADVTPVDFVPKHERRTFLGYQRASGRAGTRNYIAVMATVNCSAHAAREIAHHFTPEHLAEYPNVDGVVALTHAAGCSSAEADLKLLRRTLVNMTRHPNVGAVVAVGLGCETNYVSDFAARCGLNCQASALSRPEGQVVPTLACGGGHAPLVGLDIQTVGGLRKAIRAGIATVEAQLPLINKTPRTPQPLSDLNLALQCGGSDGWSGITANPLVGLVADKVVRHRGTVVLGETPEIYGAEHLLTRRAVSREVGEKLLSMVHWWEEHAAWLHTELNNNPSPGNKAGGLTTIYEKALGATAKGGSTPLTAVYDYAEQVTAHGFTFMNTTGYDPVAVTGQVAGGCTLLLFTTGRGSVLGFKPTPTIKIATNTAMFEHMEDDMDFNAGQVLHGVLMEDAAAELFEMVIAVASGQPSKSEAQGVGEAEFAPWHLGGTL